MTLALTETARLKADIRLAQAVSQFEAELTSEQKTAFRQCRDASLKAPPTIHDVMRLTAEMDLRLSRSRQGGRCFGPRFTNVLQAIQQFAALGDIIIGGSQNIIACGVWSLVRMALLSIVNFPSCLDKLSSLLMVVGCSAPRYERMALLYPRSKILRSHLSEYFIVVVRLAQQLSRLSKKSTLGQLVSSFPNESDVKSYQAELERWASSIREEVNLLMGQRIEEQSSSLKALWGRSESESQRRKLDAYAHVMDFCSTYDYQKTWKALRKAGNATLFNHITEYSHWKAEAKSSTLVYRGKLGSGKSVLLANIVDNLNLNVQGGDTVAYFFCRHDDFESLKADTVIGSLARQLLQSVSDPVKLWQLIQGRSLGRNLESRSTFLRQSLPRHFKAYIVLDGLDECDDRERDVILEHLQKFQKAFDMRLCVSSRIEADGTSSFGLAEIMESVAVVIPDDNPDIGGFISAELERRIKTRKLILGEPGLILEIEDALAKGAQGMFLWVALQIESLCAAKTDQEIRLALSDLPRDLPTTFLRILRRSEGYGKHHQMQTFRLIIAARRPLTTEELREALSVTPGDDAWNPAKLLNDVYSALACCGSLIMVDEEDMTVKLVHYSVKQFLLGEITNVESAPYRVANAEGELRDVIVTYLNYGVFENQVSSMVIPRIPGEVVTPRIVHSLDAGVVRNLVLKFLQSRRQPDYNLGKALTDVAGISSSRSSADQFQFYQYAKDNWLWHVGRKASPFSPTTYALFVKLVSRGAIKTHMNTDERRALLLQALYSQWDEIFKLLVENHQLDDADLQELASKLATEGNADAFQLLLSTFKADFDDALRAKHLGRTLLALAAEKGHVAVVQLLLDTGKVDVNAKDYLGWTPLTVAATGGHKSVVRLLLDTDGIDVNVRDFLGLTPLSNAATTLSNTDVVRMLLAKIGVDINTKDDQGRCPLSHAAQRGEVDTLSLLLGVTGDELIDMKDAAGRTPLSYAAGKFEGMNPDDNFMLLFKSRKISVHTKDRQGRTPFHHAAANANMGVAHFLLNNGLVDDIDQKDTKGRTPLSKAAECSWGDVMVQLLLDSGKVEVGSRDEQGRTPLSYAAEDGSSNSVQKLLKAGAGSHINSRDNRGRTPLFHATRRLNDSVTQEEVVKILLATGKADVNAADDQGVTPLEQANSLGHAKIANLLRNYLQGNS